MVPSFTNSATQGGEPVLLDFSDPMPPSPAPRGLVLHLISLSSSFFTLLPLWAGSCCLPTVLHWFLSSPACFSVCAILMTSIFDYSQSESSIKAKLAFTSCLCVPGAVLEPDAHYMLPHSAHSYTHLPSKSSTGDDTRLLSSRTRPFKTWSASLLLASFLDKFFLTSVHPYSPAIPNYPCFPKHLVPFHISMPFLIMPSACCDLSFLVHVWEITRLTTLRLK